MAKKSKIARNEQRKLVVARYAQRRTELKEIVRRPSSTDDERRAAQAALQKMPPGRESGKIAQSRRCGRPPARPPAKVRALTRACARARPPRGELPGVHKSSW